MDSIERLRWRLKASTLERRRPDDPAERQQLRGKWLELVQHFPEAQLPSWVLGRPCSRTGRTEYAAQRVSGGPGESFETR